MRTCTFSGHHNIPSCTECGLPIDLCTCEDPDRVALERIGTPTGQSIRLVQRFIRESRDQRPEAVYQFADLVREVGGLASLLSQVDVDSDVSFQEVYKSALQVAMLSVRVATEGDADFEYDPQAIFGENSDSS